MESSAASIRVLVVDGHAVVRAGLRSVLDAEPDIETMAEAADAERAASRRWSTTPTSVVNSVYDAQLDEGCAFEELISFHGGLGGPQTQPFILRPLSLPAPEGPIVGAAVHELFTGWRTALQGGEKGVTAAQARLAVGSE